MSVRSKKEDILETATLLFAEHGYHAVGVDRIISESNTAKMTLYKYFPSKDALIECVLQNRDEKLRTSILAAVGKKRQGVKKIKAIFDWYASWFKSPEFHGCMFMKAIEEYSEAALTIRAISKAHKLWLRGAIESILNEMNVKDAGGLASHIMVVLDGLTASANMFSDNCDKQVELAWSFLVGALTPR